MILKKFGVISKLNFQCPFLVVNNCLIFGYCLGIFSEMKIKFKNRFCGVSRIQYWNMFCKRSIALSLTQFALGVGMGEVPPKPLGSVILFLPPLYTRVGFSLIRRQDKQVLFG